MLQGLSFAKPRLDVARLFTRHRRGLSLRLIGALVFSAAVHLILIFGMDGTLNSAIRAPRTRMLEARLVTSRVVQSPAVAENKAPENKPPLKSEHAVDPIKPFAAPAKPAEPVVAASPRTVLPLPFDPVFYTWREVDVTAQLQGSGNPPYSALALQAGISGRVTLEVWVDETGKVSDAKVIEADPPGYFEDATLTHYRALSFTPAMKDGRPRRYRGRFLVEFGESVEILEPAQK